jgi:hypothetical protein
VPTQCVPASFGVKAATAIVVVEGEVVEMLELMRRRSLLEWDVTTARYDLHDLVRAFAAMRLKDADTVRLRYVRLYAEVATAAARFYFQGGAATLAGLRLFNRERTHFNAGWDWALAHAGSQEADELLLAYANTTVYVGDLPYDQRPDRISQLQVVLAAAQRLNHKAGEIVVTPVSQRASPRKPLARRDPQPAASSTRERWCGNCRIPFIERKQRSQCSGWLKRDLQTFMLSCRRG